MSRPRSLHQQAPYYPTVQPICMWNHTQEGIPQSQTTSTHPPHPNYNTTSPVTPDTLRITEGIPQSQTTSTHPPHPNYNTTSPVTPDTLRITKRLELPLPLVVGLNDLLFTLRNPRHDIRSQLFIFGDSGL